MIEVEDVLLVQYRDGLHVDPATCLGQAEKSLCRFRGMVFSSMEIEARRLVEEWPRARDAPAAVLGCVQLVRLAGIMLGAGDSEELLGPATNVQ